MYVATHIMHHKLMNEKVHSYIAMYRGTSCDSHLLTTSSLEYLAKSSGEVLI